MTLIVAVRDGNCAVLACDSLIVYGESTVTPEKCFKAWEVEVSVSGGANGSSASERLLVGCAGDVRAISHLRHACAWPPRSAEQDVHAWLVLAAVPAMRRAIRDLAREDGAEKPGAESDADDFVDAVVCAPHGRLFHIFPNQCVTEHADFVAAGSAAREATVAYEALRLAQAAREGGGDQGRADRTRSGLVSWEIADLVMAAAARVHSDVRGPFHMLAI